MIIDFHTHIFPPRFKNKREIYVERDPLFALLYSSPKAKLASADELIASMDENGIDVSVALNINWSSQELCQETNDYILESVARYPHRLIGFGMVKLDSPDIALGEIERCLKNGIRGIGEIRLTPELLRNTGALEPVIRKIIDSHLILLTHTSEPLGHEYSGKGNITPEAIFPLIEAFPGLNLVCAHWGGGLPFYALMPEVKKALEHVFFDTAASPFLYNSQVYPQVAGLAGAGKILFGTDYPLLSQRRLLKEIEGLDLPQNSKVQILGKNAAELLALLRS